MKNLDAFTSAAVSNAAIWTAGSAAIMYAVKKTNNPVALLAFMLLPRFTAKDVSDEKPTKEG